MKRIMRDRPDILKTELGRAAHQRALKKIKGTWWERVLFPLPVSLTTQRSLKEFREQEQRQIDAIRAREDALFQRDAEKSQSFIERAKLERREGLISAKEILRRMGMVEAQETGKADGDDDNSGPEGAA